MMNDTIHCGYAYDGEDFDQIVWNPDTQDIILDYTNDVPQVVHGVECTMVQPFNEDTQATPIKNLLEHNRNYLGIFIAEGKMFILQSNNICTVYSGSANSGPKETWEYQLFDAE